MKSPTPQSNNRTWTKLWRTICIELTRVPFLISGSSKINQYGQLTTRELFELKPDSYGINMCIILCFQLLANNAALRQFVKLHICIFIHRMYMKSYKYFVLFLSLKVFKLSFNYCLDDTLDVLYIPYSNHVCERVNKIFLAG